ncbi:MAG: hypothetical protein R3C56_00215 [Pirellulaceae bacterium]
MNVEPTETIAAASGGVFVSDLHLFSPRSDAAYVPAKLAETKSEDRCIVLGGDIFDFRWSVQGSHERTLAAAVRWLEELLERRTSPYSLHSWQPRLSPRIPAFAYSVGPARPRFDWHEHHFQLGDTLFRHGDILDAAGNPKQLPRSFIMSTPKPVSNINSTMAWSRCVCG